MLLMKKLVVILLLALSGAARAEPWTVAIKAVNGRHTYSYSQPVKLGRQAAYDGKAQMRGGGPVRGIILTALLNPPKAGNFRLDYTAEVVGENKARPPFQVSGKVFLRPGRPVLAAGANGWKLVLELEGPDEGKASPVESGRIKVWLKCRGETQSAEFAYLPEEPYSALLYSGPDDELRKFIVTLLPNTSALDGGFFLDYSVMLSENGEALASGEGKLMLSPGGGAAGAKAGACRFSAKAAR
jgi:hypothetical protein